MRRGSSQHKAKLASTFTRTTPETRRAQAVAAKPCHALGHPVEGDRHVAEEGRAFVGEHHRSRLAKGLRRRPYAARSDSSSTMRTVTSLPATCISATVTGSLKRTGPALPGLT